MLFNNLKNFINELKEYVDNRIELILLTVSEKLSEIIAESVQQIVVVLFYVIALILALFGLSYYMGEVVGNTALGFVIVSASILLIGIIIQIIKPTCLSNKIKKQLANKIIEENNAENDKNQDNNPITD